MTVTVGTPFGGLATRQSNSYVAVMLGRCRDGSDNEQKSESNEPGDEASH